MNPTRLSNLIKHLCTLGLILLMGMWLYFLIDIEALQNLGRESPYQGIQWRSVETWQWYWVWGLGLIPATIIAYGLVYLRKLFDRFSRERYFASENIRYLQRFSLSLLLQGLANPLVYTLNVIALSWNHPPGQRMLSLQFGSGDFKVLLIGLVLWTVTAIIRKGLELQHENSQFV